MADDETVVLGIADLTDAVEVGAGGFGTVYKAHQTSLRRDVAVKMVNNTVKDKKVRIRFEREIQAMGMLSGHPNIVTVYDSGFTESGQPYILMGFMEQGSLGDRLERSGPLPYADVLPIMVKVCGALETAHQAGVLHRDLKPENVLVSGYGEPKLGDFGIARLKGGPETGTSSLTASIEHVAPELLEAKPPDVGSDLYALGSTMYKLLTGGAAFVRDTDESIIPALTRIRDEPVPDLRQRGIPGPVADVVERAMAKQPSQRYASAAELGRAIRDAQAQLGLPQTAMPVREEEAALARESTRTINSDDLARSIDDIRSGDRGSSSGPIIAGPAPSGPVGAAAPPHASQPLATPGYPPAPGAAPPGPGQAPPGTGQVPPGPGQVPHSGGPGYATPPSGTGYPPHAASADGGSSPWPKVLAGIGVLAVIAIIIVVVVTVTGREDEVAEPDPPPTTTPPATETEPEEPPEYAAFEAVRDDTGSIVVNVPRQWSEVDGAPWTIGGDEVGWQIEAAEELDRFRGSWAVPGLIFSVSESLRSVYDPAGLLDALDFGGQCTSEGRQDYQDAAYSGVREDYSGCGGTDTSYTIIAAQPSTEDALLLVQFQSVDPRDEAALEQVIETFFIVPSDEPPPTEADTAPEDPEETEGGEG